MRRLSVRQLALLAAVVLLPAGAAVRAIRDSSFLWHVQAGAVQSASGEVLRNDPFSLARAGAAWRTQSWLLELGYAVLDSTFGSVAWVNLWRFGLGVSLMTLVAVAVVRRVGEPLRAALVVLVVGWMATAVIVPRPVLLSVVLLAAMVVIVDRPAVAWAAVPLVWFWASVHGSWTLGIGLLLLGALRTRDKRLWRAFAAGSVAVHLTAHGVAVWSILFAFFENRGALQFISEWGVPDFTDPVIAPLVLLLIGIGYAFRVGRLNKSDLWVVMPFAVYGLTSTRAVILAAVVVAPFAATALRSDVEVEVGPQPAWHWAVAAAMVLSSLAFVAGSPSELDPVVFPPEAADLVDQTFVHDDRLGGYLIYLGHESVFVDDRAELYGERYFRRYDAALGSVAAMTAVLEQYGIERALLITDQVVVTEAIEAGWDVQEFSDSYSWISPP